MILLSLAPEASASANFATTACYLFSLTSFSDVVKRFFIFWCRGPESNRYGCFQPRDFKSRASASSATPAATNGAGDGNRTHVTSLEGWGSTIELHQRINGASERNRTTDTGIFSPLLYQLSYRGIMATRRGLEPLTSAVTGRHSNQLNYRAMIWWALTGSNR